MNYPLIDLGTYEGPRDLRPEHVQAILDRPAEPCASDLAEGFWTVRFPAGEWLVINELERETRYARMSARGECTLHAATQAELEEAGAILVASVEADLKRWGTTE